MRNDIFSKGKSKILDTIFGVSILLLATYFMLSSGILGGGEPDIIDSNVLAELRAEYYKGEDAVPTLVVFETSWCGVCKALKKELDAKELKYKTIDVEENREIYKLYQKVYGDTSGPVPLTVAGKRVIVGNRVEMILEALAEKG